MLDGRNNTGGGSDYQADGQNNSAFGNTPAASPAFGQTTIAGPAAAVPSFAAELDDDIPF